MGRASTDQRPLDTPGGIPSSRSRSATAERRLSRLLARAGWYESPAGLLVVPLGFDRWRKP